MASEHLVSHLLEAAHKKYLQDHGDQLGLLAVPEKMDSLEIRVSDPALLSPAA